MLQPISLKRPRRATAIWDHLVSFAMEVDARRLIIRDRSTKKNVPLKLNSAQERCLISMLGQAGRGEPVRQLWPKSRKRGLSTLAQAVGRHLAKNIANWNSLTLAHRTDDAREIFSIAKRLHRHDPPPRGRQTAKSNRMEILFDNYSKYRCMSAMGNFVASGSDNHFIHVSEAALLENTSGQDAENLAAFLNSMPEGEAAKETVLILESTGMGPKGMFAAMCREAGDPDSESQYEVVFHSWLDDPDLTDPQWTGGFQAFDPPLTQYEQRLIEDCGASPSQLAWRRRTIATKHPDWKLTDGNPPLFGYHYPASLDECFASVEGAVFPRFTRSRHIGKLQIKPEWDRYRAIDWGWSGEHAFVCLWVAHNPLASPALLLDDDLPDEIADEFIGYKVDPVRGHPVKRGDHAPDALRGLVVTMKLRGLVYVYRAIYMLGAALYGPSGMARMIHERSGWILPAGKEPSDLGAFAPGPNGETYLCAVADRSQAGLITQFCNWGIPAIPHGKPDERENSRGEVWDGIAELSVLIAGDALFYSKPVDVERQLIVSAYQKYNESGPLRLTAREEDVIRRDRGLESRKSNRYDMDDEIPWEPDYEDEDAESVGRR